jgi:diguanylate cyclase
MLIDVGRLGEDTGRYSESVGRHAEVISQAESLDDLADVVKQMVDESRVMQNSVAETQARLHEEHRRAADMESRVHNLESELRRLSDEVSTDMLTQVANRRGLMQAFEAEVARIARERPMRPAAGLAIGLIDIDNFKRLNDSLGHAAGDKALQTLAAQVRDQLRPGDTVARFGGEEFVVLLPDLAADEAQIFLTKLQRKLTASLFMHENKEVFVTFSGGVTTWRDGEPLEASMERSDEALYEAKRTGKNRTCVS